MRYTDRQRPDGDCSVCSLSNYNRDCRNAPINHIAYLRTTAGLTQKGLADATGMNITQIQRLESGAAKTENITLKNAVAISKALGVAAEELLV